ncbi:MAG TPA: PASTA domain-containing protein [Actinomycetota bacterium]|nr:PASTA domain-containing protein [Actinomycetota bacterium]
MTETQRGTGSRAGRVRRRRATGGLLTALAIAGTVLPALAGFSAGSAYADGPGAGSPWVVSVGDSYISGESGRWAGNTNGTSTNIDALGYQAYFDNADHSAETFPGCHRSAKPEIYNTFGNGANWANLACSGAEIDSTFVNGVITKPGIDWAADSQGHQGQAAMLQSFAASHNVKLVTMSIGGNNFHFADMVSTCVQDYLLTPVWWQAHCSSDSSVTSNFTPSYAAAQAYAIRGAILNVHQAMRNAGYAEGSYTILVQDYPSPLASSTSFRYPESASWATDVRQQIGGCGFWNADADFVNGTAVPVIDGAVQSGVAQAAQFFQGTYGTSNVQFLELSSALNGHRLCENTVGLLEEKGIANWTSPGAADASEWVNQIRTLSAGGSGPYQQQESLHPDYWAQRAISNCLRQAYSAGSPSGRCTIAGPGLNGAGEPNMVFARKLTVPSVVGMSTAQGSTVISNAGFSPHVYQLPTCDSFTPGLVIDQSPAAGSSAYAGDLVAMTVNVAKSLRLCALYG